jgi:hypothetical protein
LTGWLKEKSTTQIKYLHHSVIGVMKLHNLTGWLKDSLYYMFAYDAPSSCRYWAQLRTGCFAILSSFQSDPGSFCPSIKLWWVLVCCST